jgi:hypothetical protein
VGKLGRRDPAGHAAHQRQLHRCRRQHRERSLADGLYRTTPQRWIDFCEGELGCSVETIDGYGMREFTLPIRCNEPAAI